MELQHLYYLLEIDRCRSINKASNCCYLSSQQLSRILRAIENEYDVSIFERTNLGLVRTKQGEKFIAEVKTLIQQNERMHKLSYSLDDKKNIIGTLNIYATPNVWSRHTGCISKFTNLYPKVKVNFFTKSPAKICRELQIIPHSVGLYVYLNDGENNIEQTINEFVHVPLTEQKLGVYCSKAHPFAQKTKSISINELKNVPLVVFKPYEEEDHVLKQIFKYYNLEPNIKYVVSDKDLFFELLNNTECIHVGSYFSNIERNDMLHVLSVKENLKQKYDLIIDRQNIDSPLVHAFLNICIEYYKAFNN